MQVQVLWRYRQQSDTPKLAFSVEVSVEVERTEPVAELVAELVAAAAAVVVAVVAGTAAAGAAAAAGALPQQQHARAETPLSVTLCSVTASALSLARQCCSYISKTHKRNRITESVNRVTLCMTACYTASPTAPTLAAKL